PLPSRPVRGVGGQGHATKPPAAAPNPLPAAPSPGSPLYIPRPAQPPSRLSPPRQPQQPAGRPPSGRPSLPPQHAAAPATAAGSQLTSRPSSLDYPDHKRHQRNHRGHSRQRPQTALDDTDTTLMVVNHRDERLQPLHAFPE